MASSSLSCLSAQVGTGPVSLFIITFSYQLQQHLHKLFSFCSVFTPEPVSFLDSVTAECSHDVESTGIWRLDPRLNQICGGPQYYSGYLGLFLWVFHEVTPGSSLLT
ncbi:hypothetical protein AMECASPLE_014129 [Ameca splendens]|uniref:Uncharacterized protein n=1 Tax=Ameca splendens TaxID=208324 RepID=A0ABV1A954_9TELE